MADDDESIDPRFDPAFQRGFEGTVGVTPRRAPLGTPSVLPAQAPPTPPAQVQPAARAVVSSYAVRPGAPEAIVDAAPEPAVAPDDEPQRRFNPFLVALAVIGVVLIVIGLVGAQFANGVYASDTLTSSISYATVLLVISGSAVSAGLGLATLIGIVFVYALRYRR